LMARDIGYNRSSRRTSVDCCCNSFADENRCTLSNRSVEPVLHRSPALEGVEHSGRMAVGQRPTNLITCSSSPGASLATMSSTLVYGAGEQPL
jgi:hypothetical protein